MLKTHLSTNINGGIIMKHEGLSRRAFLGGALATSALAAAGLGGCSPAQSAQNATSSSGDSAAAGNSQPSFLITPQPINDSAIKETIDADVVIVGCGIAGMAAARAASDEGLHVIVVEKSERFNCRGTMGSQLGSIGSKYQIEASYEEVDKTALVNRYMQDTLQMAKQSFLKHWADHSGEDVDWFMELCENVSVLELGAKVPEGGLNGNVYLIPSKNTDETSRYPQFHTAMSVNFDTAFPDDAGFYYPMLSFQNHIEENGGEFLFSTWGKQLVKENDRVSGVIVENLEGELIKVAASKAVILACGDFGNNKEMIEYYAPQAANLVCTYNCVDAKGETCNLGEGHQMALWAGAAMEKAPYAPMSHLSDTGDQLLVTRDGKRFINEELGAQSICNVIMRCPGETAFCITGESQGAKILQPGPGAKQPEALNTIEEAASVVGCEASTLQETIDRYNELCSAGADDDFGKQARFLKPIEAPYYVYEGIPGQMLVIMGGIDCDDDCRALDADGNPVSGLYVAGNTQGCRFGAEYPMTAPGISHGLALSLGRLAGKNAAILS